MEFRILGSLEVVAGGRSVPLGGARQRGVLAVLLLNAGEAVSVDRIVDELWGDSAPATGAKVVKNAISSLRAALGEGGCLITTEAHGYALNPEPDALDVERFARLVAEGRSALAAGEPRRAGIVLREALGLWRGPPLADLAYESFVQTEAARLEEERLAALEARIEADLALGRHAALVPELEVLVRDHPLRERPRAQLMLSLYRSGRQAEALETYQAGRRVLVEELGIEPERELRELHQAMLRQAPELAAPAEAESAGAGVAFADRRADLRELLEREAPLAELAACMADARAGRGRVALVAAEAGGGKTALVERFCAEGASGADILWGACDPLSTPRPLAPLLDIAQAAGGELGRLADQDADRDALSRALLARLRRPAALHVLVLEDVHWADEATLDLLRVLGRRVGQTRTLLIATYRDEETGPGHPLRAVLGDVGTPPTVRRLTLPALSPGAVGTLALRHGPEPAHLHARTGGNPFFVTEVLAARGAEVPETVRDAVLARAARCSPAARRLLDAASVIPQRLDAWLLAGLGGTEDGALRECVAAGMLVDAGGRLAFRHELARMAVEGALWPDARVELNRRALALLADPPDGAPDPARLAHHAEAAALAPEVLRHAPEAAARAAALGAHREAVAQYARALRFADRCPLETRAELLERYAHECFLTGALDEAVDAWRRAVEGRRDLGDRRLEGRGLVRLARCLWLLARRDEAREAAAAAVELLEAVEPGPELAGAYSEMSRLGMLLIDNDAAIAWGTRAIALAERLEATEVLVHALNNVGSAELAAGVEAGEEKLERSLALASRAGLEFDVARAYHNLAYFPAHRRRLDAAARWLEEGIAYCEERELDSNLTVMRANLVELRLRQGRAAEAEELADMVLPRLRGAFAAGPLCTRGLVRARRGDPDAWGSLDEALEVAEAVGGLHALHPVACARAEAAWISGDDARAATEAGRALAPAREVGDPWYVGELASWLRRAGAPLEAPHPLPEPYALELAGGWDRAAAAWAALGCHYEAALCRGEADDPAAVRGALDALAELDAPATAARVDRAARERGVVRARGPRRRSRPADGAG
jgi:DNA-binding SARP family transcriptional activator